MFLTPVVEDLLFLQRGVMTMCADMKLRTVRAWVLFATFDYPGASKCTGFLGHLALKLCRMCEKDQITISEAGGHYAVPAGDRRLRSKAMGTKPGELFVGWIQKECSDQRSDAEIRAVWKELDDIRKDKRRGSITRLKKKQKETGISRRPVIGKLNLDFVKSIPYDPMHLLLLGLIKLLLSLLLGLHDRTNSDTTYVISSSVQDTMSAALSIGAGGIPSAWGRPPEMLKYISNFKAEDFKNFGLFYGPLLFSGPGCDRRVTKLWALVSEISHIVCDPTPLRSDYEELRRLVQALHARIDDLFFVDSCHAFCFTPNTHALLHLPEMLKECGPLTNVSQFLTERLCGEMGERIGSMMRPEANLFHKTHKMFCLQLLGGGIDWDEDDSDKRGQNGNNVVGNIECNQESVARDDEHQTATENSKYQFLGAGSTDVEQGLQRRVLRYFRSNLGQDATDVTILNCRTFERGRVGRGRSSFDVETERYFRFRGGRALNPRQKYWIAAKFGSEQPPSSQEEDVTTEVYYGKIKNFCQLSLVYRRSHEQQLYSCQYSLVDVQWQYGMDSDRITGLMYVRTGQGPRRGSVRHLYDSIESFTCVTRLIGWFEYAGKRYYLDTERRRLRESPTEKLCGLLGVQV